MIQGSTTKSTAKVAIVTGSSGGIGAATAQRLAADGFSICVNYKSNAVAAEQVVSSIISQGIKAIAIKADVALEDQVARMFEIVTEKLGVPTVLINNAGILFEQCRVTELSAERINQVLATNVTGTLLCSKYAIKCMSSDAGGNGGVIVNVSSAAARLGSPGEYVDYAASKGAVDSITVGLAAEVAAQGIRVNGVRPGFIYTQMHASGGEPNRVDRLKGSLPMQRGGQPEEVAAAIAWLVSDQSSYTTGSFIEVSGGR